MTTQSAPEDPEYTSAPKTLSPVSPKPLHFPLPSKIPVLEKQIDQAFNQTGAHMATPTDSLPAPTAGQATAPAPAPGNELIDAAAGATTNGNVEDRMSGMNAQEGSEDTASTFQEDSEMINDSTTSAQVEPVSSVDAGAQSMHEASNDSLEQAVQNVLEPAPISGLSSLGPDEPQTTFPKIEANGVSIEISPDQGTDGRVDYQALLDSLSSAPINIKSDSIDDHSTAASDLQAAAPPGTVPSPSTAVGGPPSSLPPRPPPQAQPSIHPNYTQSNRLSDYHPHARTPAVQAPTQQPNLFTPSHGGPPLPPFQHAAPGANGLPPPPVASFQQHPLPPAPGQVPSPATQAFLLESQREIKQAAGESLADEDAPWNNDLQRKYDQFLEEERGYVTEGKWEQFPHGSRLFVGNLSSEKVTKRDMFHVFHTYGKLAQISIKQAYGFVQFLDPAACDRALHTEEGRAIRGKKIHLEISKPQKNSRNSDVKRRSRSPDRSRGGNAPAGVDRYVSGQGGGRRGDRGRDNRRSRDDYRPARSPSPGYRTRDRYRSRSRSPYGRNGRYRSPTPRRDADDDLPLPRRAPRDVPDVQMIVLEELDRNFISWVEGAFTSRGIRADVLLLSPRLSESAVIKRQILEGVAAVSRLTRINQQTAKIPLQVFDRRSGAEVRFEEYADLEPPVAAEVVLRAKATNAPPAPTYGYGYGASTHAPQPSASAAPNLSNIITSLDANGLQKLLGAMQSPTTGSHGTALTPDLAKFLGGAGAPPPLSAYGQPPAQDPLAALRANPALAGLLAGQGASATPSMQNIGPPPGQQGQPDMADILARLGSYRR